KWSEEYALKENPDYPLTLDDLTIGTGIFYAVINGQNKIDGKIIYQIDNLGGPTLNCILDSQNMKVLKNTDLFDINNHI
ncbi:MAG: hypothetical protein RSD40_06150, partial [Bacilli bacterium]